MQISDFSADLLADDAGAAGRSRLIDELSSMEHRVKTLLNKGLSPKEADKARTVAGAIGAARQIVDQIWDTQYN